MSVHWKGDMPLDLDGVEYGCDGDFARGHIQVDCRRDRAEFIAEVDKRIAEMWTAVLAEADDYMRDHWL